MKHFLMQLDQISPEQFFLGMAFIILLLLAAEFVLEKKVWRKRERGPRAFPKEPLAGTIRKTTAS